MHSEIPGHAKFKGAMANMGARVIDPWLAKGRMYVSNGMNSAKAYSNHLVNGFSNMTGMDPNVVKNGMSSALQKGAAGLVNMGSNALMSVLN